MATTTALRLSPSPARAYQPVTVKVTVAGPQTGSGAATPAGTVTVTGGTGSCSAALAGSGGLATGSCALREPNPGTYHLTASYLAQGQFGGSQSGAAALAVRKASASARLKLSAATVGYRHEHKERMSAVIRPQFGGVPSGKVVVLDGKKALCTARLKGGRASCPLPANKLRPGYYHLSVRYNGSSAFDSTHSPSVRLH